MRCWKSPPSGNASCHFSQKGQFPVRHWLTSITQWHSNGDHSSKLRCEQSAAPEAPEIGSLTKLLSLIPSTNITANRHHWPQKTSRWNPIYPGTIFKKLPRCFRLAGIQFKGCQVGTHFFRVELLTKVHPCDEFSVLQPEIQTLWDQQSSFQVKKPWNAPTMEKKGLGKNKNTKWPTPLIQILDQGGWMFSLRGTSCNHM